MNEFVKGNIYVAPMCKTVEVEVSSSVMVASITDWNEGGNDYEI